MKPESESNAWRQLEDHAASHLSASFSDEILRATREVQPQVWQQLEGHAASYLRPGFADRVLRAIRGALPSRMPSFFSQFALSAATAALCLLAVVYAHERSTREADQRILADWAQLEANAQALGINP